MHVQLLLNDLPKNTAFDSPTLNATVLFSGGLFFLNGEQTELTSDEINSLHSDYMSADMAQLNEFTPGLFLQPLALKIKAKIGFWPLVPALIHKPKNGHKEHI